MKITNLSKSFGNTVIFNKFNLTIPNGKISFIMGKSGAGKTTLLRIIAGLDKDYTGTIENSGKLSYVFQEPRLFPTLSAINNITLVNENSTFDAHRLLSMMELDGCENMMPSELSGGMKMRLSIARAIYYDPDIIIMDEPFSAIDKETRHSVAQKLFKLLEGKTVIIVSHDSSDAEKYADNIITI